MIEDELWMRRALQLAALGLGKVQPNPLVGAIIVHNEQIIGEGYHQQYGMLHAEVNAIRSVENQTLLEESTLYVNLEPCSHFGKTPPCTALIIEKKIPKVVIGMQDPNQKVNGMGIKTLRDACVEVIENILHDECLQLNKRFVTFHTKKRPYVFVKWAQTKNGFIDVLRNDSDNDVMHNINTPYWITNETLRVWTHKMRNEEQAIMVGYNTLKNDNPQLNNRLYGTNQPQCFILCDNRKPMIVKESFQYLNGSPNEVLLQLYTQNIQSVIVEGGKKTIQKFLEARLWDEIFVLVGNTEWKTGVKAPVIPDISENKINMDNELTIHIHHDPH